MELLSICACSFLFYCYTHCYTLFQFLFLHVTHNDIWKRLNIISSFHFYSSYVYALVEAFMANNNSSSKSNTFENSKSNK